MEKKSRTMMDQGSKENYLVAGYGLTADFRLSAVESQLYVFF
jgi:hypothetical protein